MTETTVEVNNLSRQFGSTLALDNVSFRAEKGKVYGLVGANGAGKTTLIKHIIGLLKPKSGSVSVFGLQPVLEPEAVYKRIGYLSEDRDIPDWMTIEELMRYSQAFHPNWDTSYVDELLATFSLDRSNLIKNLSRGMRAQVALIAAVGHRPDLLVLDEPSSGLDAVVRKDILNAIVRTISDEGKTVIFSSHLLEEVERMSDHVVMINNGKIALDAPLENLANQHHQCELQFAENLHSEPLLSGALLTKGSGRSWTVLHNSSPSEFEAVVQQLGGKITLTRNATLEEIFVAHAGRNPNTHGAQL